VVQQELTGLHGCFFSHICTLLLHTKKKIIPCVPRKKKYLPAKIYMPWGHKIQNTTGSLSQGFQRTQFAHWPASDPISDSEVQCCLIYLSKLIFSKEFKGNMVIWKGREAERHSMKSSHLEWPFPKVEVPWKISLSSPQKVLLKQLHTPPPSSTKHTGAVGTVCTYRGLHLRSTCLWF